MISSRKELAFYIRADRMMNRGVFRFSLRQRLLSILSPDYVMRYLVAMRKLSYYRHRGSLLAWFYLARYNRLGLKLGFSIGCDVFGYGLVIPHHGTIVVGGSNRVGNFAVLHTSTCISDNGHVIGDGLYLATGSIITSKVTLGDGVSVAANSVVNRDSDGQVLLAGSPAVVKGERKIWYEAEADGKYRERVRKIESDLLR